MNGKTVQIFDETESTLSLFVDCGRFLRLLRINSKVILKFFIHISLHAFISPAVSKKKNFWLNLSLSWLILINLRLMKFNLMKIKRLSFARSSLFPTQNFAIKSHSAAFNYGNLFFI